REPAEPLAGDAGRYLQVRRGGAAWRRDRAMTLLKRILTEKRAVVFPLLFALLVNIAVYALVVYPLNRRAAGAVARAAKAADALPGAERDQAAPQWLFAGKARAEEDLATFYDRVLPADYVSARRMTYRQLPALA